LLGQQGIKYVDLYNTKTFSQELRLSTAFGSLADVMLAGIYTKTKSPFEERTFGIDAVTAQLTLPYQQLYNGFIGPNDQRETAVFGNFTIHATDRLDMQLGGRESYIRQLYHEIDLGPLFNGYVTDGEASASVFTSLATASYKITGSWNAYARYATGYRPGGPNNGCNLSPGIPCTIKPDQTKNYEIGTKGDILDHLLSFDAAVYYIQWKDIQTGARTAEGVPYVANAGGAKSQGIELSLDLHPLSGLSISPWVSYNDAVLTESFPSTNPTYGLAGNPLPLSSRWTGALNVDQKFNLSSGLTASVGAMTRFVGERIGNFTSDALTPREIYPAYWQDDIHASLEKGQWFGSVYINNVTNRRGVALASFRYANAITYITPLTVGFSVRRDF